MCHSPSRFAARSACTGLSCGSRSNCPGGTRLATARRTATSGTRRRTLLTFPTKAAHCQFTDSSPNIFLNVLRQCFVHRLEVDCGLPEENQQRLEIDIELEFNWHRKAASINRLLQILIRESRNRCFQLFVQRLKPCSTSNISCKEYLFRTAER